MEKNRFLKIIIVCLLLLNLGILAFLFLGNRRGGRDHRHGPPEDGPAKFIIEELQLDAHQQDQFNGLKKEHQKQMRQLQDSIKTQRDLLPDAIINGNNAVADSITNNIGHYQQRIEYLTYEHFVKVKGICTEEQKKKFKNIIQDILEMMGPRKGPPPH
jgi:Spy/CpxP family protein refolding chaperone